MSCIMSHHSFCDKARTDYYLNHLLLTARAIHEGVLIHDVINPITLTSIYEQEVYICSSKRPHGRP